MRATLAVLAALTAGSPGCFALLECGAAEQLCGLLRLGESWVAVTRAVQTLANIAGEGRAAAAALIERGLLTHVCRHLRELRRGRGTASAGLLDLYLALLELLELVLRVSPPLPYSATAAVVPELALVLRHQSTASFAGTGAIATATSLLTFIFREDAPGVRFSDLFDSSGDGASGDGVSDGGGDSGDNSIFARVLPHLDGPPHRRAPALRLVAQLAALEDQPARAFTAPVLARLQRLAGALRPGDARAMLELLGMVASLLTGESPLVTRLLEARVLQTLLPRVPAPAPAGAPARLAVQPGAPAQNAWEVAHALHDARVFEDSAWEIADEMARMLTNALLRAHTAAADTDSAGAADMARLLLDAGAMRYCAHALSAAAADVSASIECSHSDTVGTLIDVARCLIGAGDRAPDTAVLAEGAVPRNAFLAAFLAAGGRSAVRGLAQSDCDAVDDNLRAAAAQLEGIMCGIVGTPAEIN